MDKERVRETDKTRAKESEKEIELISVVNYLGVNTVRIRLFLFFVFFANKFCIPNIISSLCVWLLPRDVAAKALLNFLSFQSFF